MKLKKVIKRGERGGSCKVSKEGKKVFKVDQQSRSALGGPDPQLWGNPKGDPQSWGVGPPQTGRLVWSTLNTERRELRKGEKVVRKPGALLEVSFGVRNGPPKARKPTPQGEGGTPPGEGGSVL